jgi:hypothetical protein
MQKSGMLRTNKSAKTNVTSTLFCLQPIIPSQFPMLIVKSGSHFPRFSPLLGGNNLPTH